MNFNFSSNIEARCLALTKCHKDGLKSMIIVGEADGDFNTQIVEMKKRSDEALRVKLPDEIPNMSAMSYPPLNMSAMPQPPSSMNQPTQVPKNHLSTLSLKNPYINSQSIQRSPDFVFHPPRNEVQP